MKKLADFKGTDAIRAAAKVLGILSRILSDERNKDAKADNVMGLFLQFAENSPNEMREIFAVLSEQDAKTFQPDGAEAFACLKTLANDPAIAGLFLSQRRTGDATSSGAASENTKD